MRDTLVDAFVSHSSDGGSSPPASTRQLKTKILSSGSAEDVNPGVFGISSVDSVLRGDV